ncbi:hypothetical protein JZ751_024334 [Albula glossodonta]|uniref:Pre-mRNA polyadenylation factor Fip1 domain-containing protein n=1 Tax=Albula glossodonta TaxID=121402 RepID=A0A8T2NG12_9TELE|nr:hypothetical protein JZ751_024334 [Albula glossodonta]
MATELGTSDPTSVPNAVSGPDEDEEHWLYGDENSKKQNEENLPGFQDSQESYLSSTEGKDLNAQDDDSDSDDDDVKVTIGNIKTGAPSYMTPPMNLSLKPGRGYLGPAVKMVPKGMDMETLGMNGLEVEPEVEMDIFEDKPWRKPGADLSDYFNYGFNEETWKAYCEKQRRLQLGLEPNVPFSSENKITLGGTIDVIGGQTGAIRRVEGRRREMHEQNPIQVLGDHSNKTQPFVSPAGPPPPPIGAPPPHFMHPPPPVSRMPPPLHPPGMPPPALPGLFPPPMAPPPSLLMPPMDRCPPSGYGNRAPPPFGYNAVDPNYISYPPVSSSHPSWGSSVEKGGSGTSAGHWEYGTSRRDRERDREMERERDRERDRTPTTSEYSNDDERYHYYSSHEREYHHGHELGHERGREKDERHRERRHRDKEESKHKSSKRRQHDGEEGESHRRHKHKKSKRSKEDKEEGAGHGGESEAKE